MNRPEELLPINEQNSSNVPSPREAEMLLNSKESIPFDLRRRMIFDLITNIPQTPNSETESINNLLSDIKNLLRSEPLTDQQAGILTRWMFYAKYPYKEMSERGKDVSLEEIVELRVGNWETIEQIANATFERKDAWEKATKEALNGDGYVTVYRGMSISPNDVPGIYQTGIIPPGIWRYKTFDQIIFRKLQYSLKSSSDSSYISTWNRSDQAKISRTLDLPFSKGGLLRNHWFVDPDAGLLGGVDTPDSLAMSTTNLEYIDLVRRYGNYVVEIKLPANRLVRRWEERETVDYSVLFFIEPQAISGIYAIKDERPLKEQLNKPIERP
ncbi:hypothetical protein HYU92_04130 [Candidatus Curtissbacteria bacterium]|nr:hypothetical protein [Candidatus Curtissbacteria bacterium]